jgi:hypothetical protein
VVELNKHGSEWIVPMASSAIVAFFDFMPWLMMSRVL